MNNVGIVGQHAYSLLSAREVKTAFGTERLIRLRNPWGEGEWKGEFSDTSDVWTSTLAV